jgi:SPP1 gp7 family putative phage head morphogenesis protein
MKRQLTAAKPTPIKAPKSPRGIENELADMIEFMVDTMAKRFQNQVLGQIQVKTVEKFADEAADPADSELLARYKFADAQTGNFASVLLRLAKTAKKSLLKQFSNDRIESISQKALGKLDKKSKEEFYKRVAAKTGINVTDLIAKEGLKSTTNALVAETSQWIQTLRDDTFQKFTNNTLFAMSQGESLDTIVSQFDDIVSERKNHAKFLARNQVQNYNSITTKIRAQNLGITKAVWETAGDERVRPAHADREGKEFDLATGLYSSLDGLSLLPGTDYNCRCTYTMIIPETVEQE